MDPQLYRQMRTIEDQHWWFLGRRQVVKEMLTQLGLPRDAKILDMGCGTGGNLNLLAQFGRVTGVEFDDNAAEMARDRKVGMIFKGSLPNDMPFAPQEFDLIVLLDVLEHIDDDSASLRTLATLLAPGGHLVVTVPAFRLLWSAHDEEHHHKRRYTAADIRGLFTGSSLNLRYLSYYNTWLFPAVAAVRLIGKLFPSRQVGRDVKLPPPMINKFLLALFGSERHWIGRLSMPFGISLLAVAQKSK